MRPHPPNDAADIFSLSDHVLAERLQFVQEIGFGNWGSVWLCKPKHPDTKEVQHDVKLAVKLVHRSKTTTTAARVRSLWNEMKIVRTFKHDPHPSIVPFHSFIITPSYALITMDFLPELIPVEVPEHKAKEWMRSLLSGVEFLHKRGVVHNDIKPANILLTEDRVPVLVDFGFAEKYDTAGSKAFHSNLTYGTPEYLSPERARGLPHDTRKSDVWSLGVTFFEILVGRTPYENEEGEQFTTKEDLEKYWARTLRGKWVGTWKMSKGAERLLRRMIQPNADLRCMAADAMKDSYWTQAAEAPTVSHKRAASTSSISRVLGDKEGTKLLDIISPWSTRRLSKDQEKERKTKVPAKDKENIASPPPSLRLRPKKDAAPATRPTHTHTRSLTQPKIQTEGLGAGTTRKRAAIPGGLTPIAASPPATPSTRGATTLRVKTVVGKENAAAARGSPTSESRRALGPRKPIPSSLVPKGKENGATPPPKVPPKDRVLPAASRRAGAGALTDVTGRARNAPNARKAPAAPIIPVVAPEAGNESREEGKSMGSVRDRMREWEREKERLRELERVHEREADGEKEKEGERGEGETEERGRSLERAQEVSRDEKEKREEGARRVSGRPPQLPEFRDAVLVSTTPTDSIPATPMSPEMDFLFQDTLPRSVSGHESGLSILKRSLKTSLDRTFNLYKTSFGFGRFGKSTSPENDFPLDASGFQSWEDASLMKEADSSLPAVHQAVRNERVGVDNRADRMTIWLQNVEKVVEDARQNFASSSVTQLPPLPIAPSRSTSHNVSVRSSRLPRKLLAASEIFSDSDLSPGDRSFLSASASSYTGTVNKTRIPDNTLPTIPSEEPSRGTLSFDSPKRMRRATVLGQSPGKSRSLEIDPGSPSHRREKSRSQNDLQRAISPVSKLTFELDRLAQPSPPMRLSAMIDKDIFIGDPANLEVPKTPIISITNETGNDSLTASPFHVQPYPVRVTASDAPLLDSPTQRKVEGVYDRFLMATTGVKRLGRGYQSDNVGPLSNVVSTPLPGYAAKSAAPRLFQSTRRPMPPPVSSDDQRGNLNVDELGMMHPSTSSSADGARDERTHAVRTMRKAFKAIVTGRTVVRKSSRVY
ncbi:hypothetical protein OF83DRAFT_1061408 [Amylostereum chailletii]|nr:hypothetical protein OF83DRAFT_1061408 [Amylostereum chailletii]